MPLTFSQHQHTSTLFLKSCDSVVKYSEMTLCFSTCCFEKPKAGFRSISRHVLLVFQQNRDNDFFSLWRTHRTTLSGITQVLTESRGDELLPWISSPSPTVRGPTRPTPPWRLTAAAAAAAVFEVQAEGNECNGCDAAERSQASNKRKSLRKRWKTEREIRACFIFISDEGGWPYPDPNPPMKGSYHARINIM